MRPRRKALKVRPGRQRRPPRRSQGRPPPPNAKSSRPAPERRCIVTGEVQPKTGLIRFVVAPDGTVVPDVAESLPGRGLWLSARKDIVVAACRRSAFAKAARRKVAVPADLVERLDALLSARCRDLLGLARRAGQAVAGAERVRVWLTDGRVGLVLAAADGAGAAPSRARKLAPDLPVVEILTAAELGAGFGRETVVYAAVAPGRLAESLRRECARLAGVRAAR